MATLFGANLDLVQTVVRDGATIFLDGPTRPTSITIDGTRFVYVPTDDDDGVQIFTMDDDGFLTAVGTLTDTGGITLDGARQAEAFEVGGNPFLAVIGRVDDGVTIFSLTDSAPYATFVDRVFDTDNAALELDVAASMTITQKASTTILTVAGYSDDGLSTFLVASDGTLTNVTNLQDSDNPLYELNGAYVGQSFDRFGFDYIAVGGEFDDGMSIFEVNPDGTLTFRASINDPTTPIEPLLSAAARVGTDIFIFAPSVAFDEVYLFKYVGGSTIELVDRVTSSALLDRSLDARVINLGDETYFISGSLSNEGITLFRLDKITESLEIVQNIRDTTGLGQLSRSSLSEPITIGDKTFIIVSGENDNAVNVFEIGGGADIIEGTFLRDTIAGRSGDDILSGLGGDDDLFGEDGDDTLNGGSGDDLILGGDGDDTLNGNSGNDALDGGGGDDLAFGGSGNDTLLVSEGEDTSVGGSGADLVDARSFNGASAGVTIDFLRGNVILPDGAIQSIDGFENAIGTNQGDTLIGDDKANALSGRDGNDLIRGRDGNDELRGGIGEDGLYGAGGDDEIYGENGRDVVNGGDGDDMIDGGGADDRLFAGNGDDTVIGGIGDDLIKGNGGNDFLFGDAGNDRLEGQTGDDILFGGGSSDILIGGGGRDTLNAGSGLDTMTGGSAADVFIFDTVLAGGGGNNTITDFKDGIDMLDFSSYGLTAAGVLALAAQVGSTVEITFADGQIARLNDFTLSDLDASDLIL